MFEKTPGAGETPPPELGEHNAAIYTALGMAAAEQAGLKAKGVI